MKARQARQARTARATWPLLAVLALALAAAPARADEQKGIVLTRQAQAALAAGDAEGAIKLLEQARTEWPGSAIVANTLGDAHRELGQLEQAVHEYERGMRDGCQHHAYFNRGVTQNELGEKALGEARVPADVAGLPEGPQPQMLQAITDGLASLEPARKDFLEALGIQDDRAGRESVGALNRRIDALRAMHDELQKRQEQEQEKDQDKQGDDKDQQDQQQDGKDQPKDQPQDPGKDQQPKDGQDQQQNPQDQPQDGKDQQGQQDQPQEGGGQPGEAQELSKEEVQQLLDKLDRLEKQGRMLQKAQQAARHQDVGKDW